MIVLLLLPVLFVVFLLWRRHRRKAAALPPSPLAGYDTGVRSPYRVPGHKMFGPRRGF